MVMTPVETKRFWEQRARDGAAEAAEVERKFGDPARAAAAACDPIAAEIREAEKALADAEERLRGMNPYSPDLVAADDVKRGLVLRLGLLKTKLAALRAQVEPLWTTYELMKKNLAPTKPHFALSVQGAPRQWKDTSPPPEPPRLHELTFFEKCAKEE